MANGVVTSRQASANVPGPSSPIVQPAVHSKSERHVPALLRPISRLLSKDNEILDGVKPPPQATSPALKHKKSKKDKDAVKVDQDVPLQVSDSSLVPPYFLRELCFQTLEQGQSAETGQPEQTSRPQSIQQQYSRLSKIDEGGEVLIQLLNESDEKKRKSDDQDSIFYLSETPPPKPPRPQFPTVSPPTGEDGSEEVVDGVRRRVRPSLPHQQRNVPSADEPPPNTKEPPSTL